MSRYDALWRWIQKNGEDGIVLSFRKIEEITGQPVSHSFLTYKKELLQYGYRVGKISMKRETVEFLREDTEKAVEKERTTARHIEVVPYDSRWDQDFLAIRAELEEALGDLVMRIEHVGSTSVPGLSAKPIIDIDVVIRDRSLLEDVISAFGRAGYRHEGDLGIPGREAFGYDGKEHLREHHLYVCPQDSAELRRHIAFRDHLRSHPEAVWEYSRIKEEGAAMYPYDMDGYIEYKSPFIEGIYRDIGV